MGFSRKKPEEPRVELTAMIDVVFLLLIFFMISTTFIERPGLRVELPEAGANAIKIDNKEVHVYLSAEGDIYLERDKVSYEELEEAINAYLPQQAKQMTFLLMADKAARHGKVVALMDAARNAGFGQLAIATDKAQQ